MGSKEGFLKVAEIIARLHAAGQDLVERKINGVGGKGDSCWKNAFIRQEGMDSVPRWAAGPARGHRWPSCRMWRAVGPVGGWTVGGHGMSLLRVLFFWGNRKPDHQLRPRMRVSGERWYQGGGESKRTGGCPVVFRLLLWSRAYIESEPSQEAVRVPQLCSAPQ